MEKNHTIHMVNHFLARASHAKNATKGNCKGWYLQDNNRRTFKAWVCCSLYHIHKISASQPATSTLQVTAGNIMSPILPFVFFSYNCLKFILPFVDQQSRCTKKDKLNCFLVRSHNITHTSEPNPSRQTIMSARLQTNDRETVNISGMGTQIETAKSML